MLDRQSVGQADLGFDIDAACQAALKRMGERLNRSCAQTKRRLREKWAKSSATAEGNACK